MESLGLTTTLATVAVLVVLAALAPFSLGKLLRGLLQQARTFWLASRIPGPTGGVFALLGPLEDVLDKALAVHRHYGSTVRIWAWPVVTVVVTEPEDVEAVICSPHANEKPDIVYGIIRCILGDGLICLPKAGHRLHRKAVSPSLHLDILKDFVPTFEKNARVTCRLLEEAADNGEVLNVVPLLLSYTSNTICETVFSTEFDTSVEKSKEDFTRVLMTTAEILYYRIMNPWFKSDLIFHFSSKRKMFNEAVDIFDSFADMMLQRKKEQLKDGPSRRSGKRLAFLDHVLTSKEGQVLSDQELKDELKTLSGAAVGTTTDFLSYFFLVVSMLPDVQDNIIKELDDVFGGSDRSVEYDDLAHMQYLESVVKETMRLFPPVFSFSRYLSADLDLPSGHTLPAGCIVAFLPYFTHRNPKHFPDPEKFDPYRFLPENCRGRHPYAYIPFSIGARNCVGYRYALTSVKVITSTILRRFRVLPAPFGPKKIEDIKVVAGISASPKGGSNVRLERRGGASGTFDRRE